MLLVSTATGDMPDCETRSPDVVWRVAPVQIAAEQILHWFNAESLAENNFGYGRDHGEHDFSQTTGEE